jgi:hypothetical protein
MEYKIIKVYGCPENCEKNFVEAWQPMIKDIDNE